MTTTLLQLFKSTFDRDTILAWARDCEAVVRLRRIHPQDFALALVGCALGDEKRSVAGARRLFDRIAGFMPEESSFYDRFTVEMAELMRRLFLRALEICSFERREALAKMLGGTGLLDVLAIDASQVSLPASAARVLPSTHEAHGGFKLTATLSLLFQKLARVEVTDARTHDRKALKMPRWLHGQLFLLDRGYSDHRLFRDIANRKGFFLTRLKESSVPVITAIRSGLGQQHVGKELAGDLPYRGVVDLDARFRVRGGGTREFRVIRVVVEQDTRDGYLQDVDIWLVTNLDPEDFTAEQLATIYRMRWEVEILFRALKSVGRLDQLHSASLPVIHAFLYASLLGVVLAHDITAHMRRIQPEMQPSLYRVMTLLLGYLPHIVARIGTRYLRKTLLAFEAALWREGTNPNPGRPYAVERYAWEVCHAR